MDDELNLPAAWGLDRTTRRINAALAVPGAAFTVTFSGNITKSRVERIADAVNSTWAADVAGAGVINELDSDGLPHWQLNATNYQPS